MTDGSGIVLAVVIGSAGVIALLISFQVFRKKRKWELLKQQTSDLQSEDILELQVTTHLSEQKIRALYHRYKELDTDNSGTITAAEFCKMEEMIVNPLSYRIFDAFDKNNDGHLDFKEFIDVVTTMAPNGNKQEKLEILFNIYDVDGDGRINKQDLKYILELVTIRPKTKDELKGLTKSKKGMSEEEIEEEERAKAEENDKRWDEYIHKIIDAIMRESSSHPMCKSLSAEDFSKAISESRLDFQEVCMKLSKDIPFQVILSSCQITL
jgi:serine/threonine-protein phosphatase 2B regulatory subunit